MVIGVDQLQLKLREGLLYGMHVKLLLLVNVSHDHKIVIKSPLSFILIMEAPPKFTNHVI